MSAAFKEQEGDAHRAFTFEFMMQSGVDRPVFKVFCRERVGFLRYRQRARRLSCCFWWRARCDHAQGHPLGAEVGPRWRMLFAMMKCSAKPISCGSGWRCHRTYTTCGTTFWLGDHTDITVRPLSRSCWAVSGSSRHDIGHARRSLITGVIQRHGRSNDPALVDTLRPLLAAVMA